MSSRPRVALLAAACALVAAVAASAATSPSETVLLAPADVAMAKRIVLQKGDLGPGWMRKGSSGTSTSRSASIGGSTGDAGCDVGSDLSKYTITGSAGADYGRKGAFVGSSVVVFPTTAQATGDLAASMSPAARKCMAQAIGKVFGDAAREGGGGVVHFQLGATTVFRSASFKGLGARHVYAYAIGGAMVGPGGTFPITTVILAFSKGRVAAMLFGTSAGKDAMQMAPFARKMVARFPGSWIIAR
jgi:hypothetical protein